MLTTRRHPDARVTRQLTDAINAGPQTQRMVVIDMSQVEELNTAELAELVTLRQRLLHSGRDLQLVGLRGRAKALYDLAHLAAVLPAAM
jgi:anti-anti-sigma regulatory factor